MAREVERVDSGYRSAFCVQSSPGDVPDPRLRLGGAEGEVPAEAAHRRMGRLLRPDRARCRLRPRPRCARGRRRSMAATSLNGSKTWITNSPIADVAVVWAKDDEGILRGFLLERGMKGLTFPKIEGKFSLRASRHRHDHDGRGLRARGEPPARREVAGRPLLLPQPRPLRHRLGRARRGRVLLARARATTP